MEFLYFYKRKIPVIDKIETFSCLKSIVWKTLKSLIKYTDIEFWKLLYSSQTRLLAQTTKQPLSNFEPVTVENISNFESWGLTLVAYKKPQSRIILIFL